MIHSRSWRPAPDLACGSLVFNEYNAGADHIEYENGKSTRSTTTPSIYMYVYSSLCRISLSLSCFHFVPFPLSLPLLFFERSIRIFFVESSGRGEERNMISKIRYIYIYIYIHGLIVARRISSFPG